MLIEALQLGFQVFCFFIGFLVPMAMIVIVFGAIADWSNR